MNSSIELMLMLNDTLKVEQITGKMVNDFYEKQIIVIAIVTIIVIAIKLILNERKEK